MSQRGNERRTKLRLLLTPSELRILDNAVNDTATTRSLLVLEAMLAGLSDPRLKVTQEKRSRRTDMWVPKPVKEQLRQLAHTLHVSQQHLTRHLLLTYLNSAPWNPQPQPRTEDEA